jgi:AcrR family transcriptional regulator
VTAESPEPARRRGPRHDDARGLIVAAAREEFAESGFDAATVRAIAARAGVNAAMINHYFGGKAGLFREVVALPVDPGQVVAGVVEGPREELGRRLVLGVLGVWEDPQTRAPMLALYRSGIADPARLRPIREYLAGQVLPILAGSGRSSRLDAALIVAHLLGLVMGRYVLELPELCAPTVEELADRVGEVLQAYIQTTV